MYDSTHWGSSRYFTLLCVLTVHIALLAWLVSAMRSRQVATAAGAPVELLALSSPSLPRIRVENIRPRRLDIGAPRSMAPPLLEGESTSASERERNVGAKDGGAGVDWAAEARRALQAFEIRSRQPAGINSVSRNSPAEQPWWPAHRPGERFKTADGNWIVWVNSSCYQVATSSPSRNGSGPQPQTVCTGQTHAPHAESADPAH